MTRPIKFRAWDVEEKKMVSWKEIAKNGWAELVLGINYTVKENNGFNLMQFTGLKDKNGKEIYEGDRVKMTFKTNKVITKENSAVVKWDAKKARFTPGRLSMKDTDIEVIGNIYENRELIQW